MAQKLCDATGAKWHPTTIAKIEAGDRSVRIDEAVAIAEVLEVPLDVLVGSKGGLEEDFAYALRVLQETSQKSVADVNTISTSLADRLVDLLAFEFDGRDAVDAVGKQATGALGEVIMALYALAAMELPHGDARVTSRAELFDRAAYERLGLDSGNEAQS
jgi:transcriptional regulator with XRE-family HTH domain